MRNISHNKADTLKKVAAFFFANKKEVVECENGGIEES